MAVFKYVTRGEQTAQGKQKVYFCAHPDDYGRYFERIIGEILGMLEKENNRNCAFFYLEDANAERDNEFLFSFKEMNLIVIPVTTRLLTTTNPALDIEFKFALENHISVLPLMMESGLEDVFNAKCGDIQYLDPYSRDATAISYEEKLTKYLTSALIGDELAEKIRNAFDAYIFLSYRKKDRKYAQELMRLIHKNDFCRDIAIWYDEFLTPGENFNNSIKAALEKSKLFALAVTPNLINEENYIMKVEYPMAKKEDKLILPAELVETDKKALSEKYDGIPECVRSKDESELSASLENALEGIALRENDNDPEHNFFIGLAYLGGVDVERDSARALELITSSANSGLPEAMEQLVTIYCKGEAATRDIEKAIEWQRKLVNVRQKEFEIDQSQKRTSQYVSALEQMGNFWIDRHRFDEAESIFTEMINICKKAAELYSDNKSNRDLSVSYMNLGDIFFNRDNPEKASHYYSKALDIRAYSIPGATYAMRKMANQGKQGELEDLFKSHGMLAGLEELRYRQFAEANESAFQNDVFTPSTDVIKLHCKLAETRGAVNDYYGAMEHYSEAEKIGNELLQRTNNRNIKAELAYIYKSKGDFYQRMGNSKEALNIYGKACDLLCTSDISTYDIEYRNLLVSCDIHFINHYLSVNDYDSAEEILFEGLPICENIVDETGAITALQNLALLYCKFAEVCKVNYSPNDTEYYYLQALNILNQLTQLTPNNLQYKNQINTIKKEIEVS